MIVFVSGGARSGKSRYAELRAMEFEDVTYIATALALDPEMHERIARHQSRRPAHWKTVEAYKGLGGIFESLVGAVILDCLTVMITNLMMEAPLQDDMSGFDWDKLTAEQAGFLEGYVMEEMNSLADGLKRTKATVFIVSNELGMGLVPAYPFGRAFRDVAGRVNAMFAELSDEAVFLVSSLPLKLK